MITADNIEKEIVKALEDVATDALKAKSKGNEHIWPDNKWTKEIKNRMIELAKYHDFKASGSTCDGASCGEWLFDIAWYKYNDKPKKELVNVFLSMEIEWGGYTDIRVDFEKLLVARTNYRVMVFQSNTVYKKKDELIDRIKAYQGSQKGDRYLLIGWNNKKQNFEMYHYIA
jgi:hypothetical protein